MEFVKIMTQKKDTPVSVSLDLQEQPVKTVCPFTKLYDKIKMIPLIFSI